MESSVPTKPKTELAKTPFLDNRYHDVFVFCFLFVLVLVEVPNARMREVSGFRFCF